MVETRAGSRKRKYNQTEQWYKPKKTTNRRYGAHTGKVYFDYLPQDTLANIIRFTSDRPRSVTWKAFIPADVALGLLKSKTVLASCCLSLFSILEAFKRFCPERTSLLVVGSDDKSRIQFTRLMSALRETLTEILINRDTFPVAWKQSLMLRCSNLKRLSLYSQNPRTAFPLSEILAVQNMSLKFLEIIKPSFNKEDALAITEHGKGLTGFSLCATESIAGMGAVWESVGASLEELKISQSHIEFDFNFRSILHNCKKLRKLYFSYIRDWCHEELEDLCKGLGNQLESLSLRHCKINPSRLGRIVAACRNVAVELAEVHGCALPAVRSLGAHARRVDLGMCTTENPDEDSESLRLIFDRCDNLEYVFVWPTVPEVALRALVASPKPRLLKVSGFYGPARSFRMLLEAFTNAGSRLEELDISGLLPSRSVMQAFVRTNPILKKFR